MDSDRVEIKQGALKGNLFKTENNIEYFGFLGIPYAKPPLGKFRFKAPQPAEVWEGVREATAEPKVSPQIDTRKTGIFVGSEDCLYLNVYSPKYLHSNSKLPVMAYIHDGGFNIGNATAKDDKGPDYLIEKDVVVVMINYRLGIFGFLCLDIPQAQGNMGLKDQIAALRWIKDNIESFGGDSSNVTVFGHSAGAASVDYLIVSPTSKNLFQKAIVQSGSALSHWARSRESRKLAQEVASQLGHTETDVTSLYMFLMNTSAQDLTEKSCEIIKMLNDKNMYLGWVPTIEIEFEGHEAFLIKTPYEVLKNGEFEMVPTIRGFCEFECFLFNGMKLSLVERLLSHKNMARCLPYSVENLEMLNTELKEIYMEAELTESEGDAFALKFYSDVDFLSGIWITGKIMATQVPVYMYKFIHDGGMNYLKNIFGITRPGAAHIDDLGYIFRVENVIGRRTDSDMKVVDHFATLWTNFAKNGNPNPLEGGNVEWLPFTEDETNCLVISEHCQCSNMNNENRRMKFLEDLLEKYEK